MLGAPVQGALSWVAGITVVLYPRQVVTSGARNILLLRNGSSRRNQLKASSATNAGTFFLLETRFLLMSKLYKSHISSINHQQKEKLKFQHGKSMFRLSDPLVLWILPGWALLLMLLVKDTEGIRPFHCIFR